MKIYSSFAEDEKFSYLINTMPSPPLCLGSPKIPSPPSFTLLTPLDQFPPIFSLSCVSTSFPPTNVSWRVDGESIPDEDDFQITQVINLL